MLWYALVCYFYVGAVFAYTVFNFVAFAIGGAWRQLWSGFSGRRSFYRRRDCSEPSSASLAGLLGANGLWTSLFRQGVFTCSVFTAVFGAAFRCT